MKKTHLLSLFVVLAFLVSTAPASAFSFGASLDTKTHIGDDRGDDHDDIDDDDKGDDHSRGRGPSVQGYTNASATAKVKMEKKWMNWVWNAGISGTVTDKDGDELTVKASNGTTYDVDASDAKIRGANGSATLSSVAVGDKVWIQGVIDGNDIVASLIIDAKKSDPKPNSDDTRAGIAGTVTAQSGDTLTVIGKNGTTYKVNAEDATIWKNKTETNDVSDVDVGDSVLVQGTINGTNVTATRVYAVEIPETTANGGVRGTVTAIDEDSITLLATGGTTYTVDTSDADYKDHKNKDEDWNDVKVGEMITVQGDVDGDDIEAESVTEVHEGFFFRVGNFFKHLFKGKNK